MDWPIPEISPPPLRYLNGAQWPTQAKSTDDRKWPELQAVSDPRPHVLQARLLSLAVEREESSWPGRILASRRKQLRSLLPTWERERGYQPSPKKTFTILIPHQEPGRGSPEVIAKDAINLYLIFTAAAQLLRKCRAGSRNWVMFKDLRWPGPIALRGQASDRVLLGTVSVAGEERVPQHALEVITS